MTRSSDASRITHLPGDSSTFASRTTRHGNLVYVEGSGATHGSGPTRRRPSASFRTGGPCLGRYLGDPSLYAYLNELAPSLDRPIVHILGTRLALYSR